MTYMIIKTGGKQYRAEPGQYIDVEKLEGDAGSELVLDQVLLYSDDKEVKVGQPLVENASVKAEIMDQFRDKKVISFKYIRRNGKAKTKIGHRQSKTRIMVKELTTA
ncbi:MAG: large subunit ribosomal protein L21 [Candidatus Omnitrophota bacterium]|jgi:large subunit ribosomal protein L21